MWQKYLQLLAADRAQRWGWGPSSSLVRAMVAVLLFWVPWVTAAEHARATEEFHDRLMIRGGWAHIFGANADATLPGPITGIGTSIDFAKTLGGDTSSNAFRLDTLYRFNERHALGLSWYRVGLGGQRTLNEQLHINDYTIQAGANANSSLNFNLYRLIYNYSFYRTDKVELAVSPGLYMADTKFHLTAHGNVTVPNGQAPFNVARVTEDLTVPLPSIGLVVNYNITPRFQFQTRGDFFYVTISEYQGAMFEFYAGLEYRLFKHLALGAAYDRLSAGLRDTTTDGYEFSLNYNVVYLYATLYLF